MPIWGTIRRDRARRMYYEDPRTRRPSLCCRIIEAERHHGADSEAKDAGRPALSRERS